MADTAAQPSAIDSACRLAQWAELAGRATQCGRLLRSQLAHAAAAEGLSETEFFLLWACRSPGGAGKPQSQLAAELGVSAAQVSALVERLQGLALIAPQRDPLDRRRQRCATTPSGETVLARSVARLEPWLDQAEAGFDRGQLAALVAALSQLVGSLDPKGAAPSLRIVSPDDAAREASP